MKWSILLSMIFLHIIDDFFLQSAWLVNGKQKSWWEKVAPDKMYKYDYLMALAMHAMSWSFMVMLPIMIYRSFDVNVYFVIYWAANAFLHGWVDNAKANHHMINLIADQGIHLVQIGFIFTMMCIDFI